MSPVKHTITLLVSTGWNRNIFVWPKGCTIDLISMTEFKKKKLASVSDAGRYDLLVCIICVLSEYIFTYGNIFINEL